MTLLHLHVAATWFLVGLIWTVQVVHYPMFAWVADAERGAVQRWHMSRITWIVAPAMLVELGTAAWFAWAGLPGVSPTSLRWGLGLVAAIWLSTALVQAPAHARLAERFEPRDLTLLVRSNWLRTGLWTARGLLVLTWLGG